MLDQPIQRTKKKPNSRINVVAISLMATTVAFVLLMAVFPSFVVSGWLYGVLGVYCFALFVLGFVAGLAIYKRRRYHVSRRYIILSSVMLFSLFCAIHVAFTASALGNLSYGDYLAHGFSNITPGGLLFGIMSYMLHAVFFLEGALVVLGVVFIVALAFMTTMIISEVGENKVIKKISNPQTHDFMYTQQHVEIADKKLDHKLEEEYQKLLEEKSRKSHKKAKSEFGLTDINNTPKREATYDQPIPLADIEPSVADYANTLSTYAARQFAQASNHINNVETRLKAPLYVPLGKNFAKTAQPEQINNSINNPIFTPPHNPGIAPQFNTTAGGMDFVQPTFSPPPPSMPFTSFPKQTKPDFASDDSNVDDTFGLNSGLNGSNSFFNNPPPPPIASGRRMSFSQTTMDTESVKKPTTYKRTRYVKPSVDMIRTESSSLAEFEQDAIMKQALLNSKLKEFGVNAKVTNYTIAPAVTRFEIQLASGTRVSHVTQLESDIALVLGTPNVRIENAIEGKNAMGVEVPNRKVGCVSIKDLLNSKQFMEHKSPLAVAIGKSINDELIIGDIASMPHLLIAGSTGSGKSVALNTILTSLLFRANPDDVKLLLLDPKKVELNTYNRIPHMLVPDALKEVPQMLNALKWVSCEMERRYNLLEESGVNNIGLYHALPDYQRGILERMPYLLVVVDEVADLFSRGKKEVEELMKSLAALARASGIHIILATQRPSADVITGVIKINFPVRIAFKVGSRHDSATILDGNGAEKLVGRGDMLFQREGMSERVQGAYIERDEATAIMNFIRANNPANFDEDLKELIINGPPNNSSVMSDGDGGRFRQSQDPMFVEIAKWIVREDNVSQTVSISQLQRLFSFGFARAGKIMDQLTQAGFVGPEKGSKARDVIASREEIERLYGE